MNIYMMLVMRWKPNFIFLYKGFPCDLAGKGSACNAGDLGSIPGLGRSPGEGKGHPLQYSGLENSMDCIVHGVAKSLTWLSDFSFHVGRCRVLSRVPCATQRSLLVIGIIYSSVYMSVPASGFIPPRLPPGDQSVFSKSVTLFLCCQ